MWSTLASFRYLKQNHELIMKGDFTFIFLYMFQNFTRRNKCSGTPVEWFNRACPNASVVAPLYWVFSLLFLATDKLTLKGTEQKLGVEMEI